MPDAERTSRVLVDDVADGDGGRHFEEVGHESAIEAAEALLVPNVRHHAEPVDLVLVFRCTRTTATRVTTHHTQ